MQPVRSLVESWFAREPAACLWLAVAALLLFGLAFIQSKDENALPWTWLRRLVEALAKTLVFVGLAAMVYFLLDTRSAAFNRVYAAFSHSGSLSNQALDGWLDVYGGGFVQQDLSVTHYVTVEKVEQFIPTTSPTPTRRVPQATPTITPSPTQPIELALRPTLPILRSLVESGTPTAAITPTPAQPSGQAAPATPTGRALYHTVVTEQPLSLNSIIAFDGRVTLNLAHPEWQPDSFNSYVLTALYQYQVSNPSGQPTRAGFRFPLFGDTRLYQHVRITRNGVEIPSWRIVDQAITWDVPMQPGQQDSIAVSYQSTGSDGFVFEIPEQREVTNFGLTLAADTPGLGLINEPEDGGIQQNIGNMGGYTFINWKIDRAIIAPRLGMVFIQRWPYAPYYEITVVTGYAPRAALLFLSLAVLTLLTCAVPVRLIQMALLAALFILPFLILMAGGFPLPDIIPPQQFARYQVMLLPVTGLLALALAFWVLRTGKPRLPRLPRALLLVLLALFMGGYGFIGLLPDSQKRNAVESAVQAAMIAYVFLLALFTRLRHTFRWRLKPSFAMPAFLRPLSRPLSRPLARRLSRRLPRLRLPALRMPRLSAPARREFPRLAFLAVLLLAVTLFGSLDRLPHFTRPQLPPPPGPRITPISTPLDPFRITIPPINGSATHLFFAIWTDGDWLNGPRFSKAQATNVYWTLVLKYPPPSSPVEIPLHFIYYRPDGSVLYEGTGSQAIPQGSTETRFQHHWGWEQPGRWQPGIYRLEVDYAGTLLANSTFEITE